MSCTRVLQREQSGDGVCETSTLCKYAVCCLCLGVICFVRSGVDIGILGFLSDL